MPPDKEDKSNPTVVNENDSHYDPILSANVCKDRYDTTTTTTTTSTTTTTTTNNTLDSPYVWASLLISPRNNLTGGQE